LGWRLGYPYAGSDSFTVSGSATVTSFDFAVWSFNFDYMTSIDWSIGTTVGGSDLGSGTAVNPPGVYDLTTGPWDVYTFTISGLNLSLPASGTYYLTLQNAVAVFGGTTPDGDNVYWDENDGPSAADQDFNGGSYYTLANNDLAPGAVCANGQVTCTGSETFNIYGTANSSAAPEPGSPILFGSGLLLLAGALRRKRLANR
jgi:hypothetical protein